MVTRAQIDRIGRQIDRLASTLDEANRAHVPLYDSESEAEALRAYGRPVSGNVVFNRARLGDRRQDCKRGEWMRSFGSDRVTCAGCSLKSTVRRVEYRPSAT